LNKILATVDLQKMLQEAANSEGSAGEQSKKPQTVDKMD
jgi:hypothetical protein